MMAPFKELQFPEVLIIGSRKGGTGVLKTMLGAHPQIEVALGEVHYFDNDKNYALGKNWYDSCAVIFYVPRYI